MFERYTDQSRRALVLAQEEARAANSSFIGSEHLLCGLCSLPADTVAATVLAGLGITAEAVRADLLVSAGPAPGSPPFTDNTKRILELALREALQLGHSYVAPEHLLLAFARADAGRGPHFLGAAGISSAALRGAVIAGLYPDQAPAMDVVPPKNVVHDVSADALYAVIRAVGVDVRPDLESGSLSTVAAALTTEVLSLLERRFADAR